MKPWAPVKFPSLLTALLAAANLSTLAQSPPALPEPVFSESYGRLPIGFEANQGQTDPSVQFLSHGLGYALFLRSNEAVMALQPASDNGEAPVVRMKLVGASRKTAVSPEDRQITRTNYFLGNNPGKWRTGIPNFGRIHYRSIYDGIDLVYYGNQRRLEHDFVISPHADPAKIILAFDSSDHLRIDLATGDLVLAAGARAGQAELRLLKPVAYQESDGHRTRIASRYKLLPGNRIGFLLGAYDRSRSLVIDPVLVYSTYLGGGGSNGNGDRGNGIAVDSSGNAYVVGTTYSTNFPSTTGSFQSQNDAALAGHGSTVFVAKLNATGTALVYSTYLGGSGSSSGGDFGYGIALDSSNNAYITGATYSADFPVTCGAFQTANPSTTSGATTAFVSRLTADGNALTYSTYLGGSGNQTTPAQGDVAQAIVVDASGSAYVTGYTSSPNFPVTDEAFQTQYGGSATISNAFVTKLNASGTSLVYSTYLGGSGTPAEPDYNLAAVGDYGNAIAIDAAGDAFVAGSTASTNFPVTAGAFQTVLQGPSNAFVTELNPAGTTEVYSTYLGGSGQPLPPPYPEYPYVTSPAFVSGDSANAIAVDSSGFAYIAGNTTSNDFPVSSGVLEGASDFDNSAGFVTKLKQDGSALEYSTYLEGMGTLVSGLAVDSSGNAYITGSAPTVSAGFPAGFQATPDALATPASSGTSAFLVKLNSSAATLNYATLLGGSSNDAATAVALDAAGDAYLTGSATSANLPTTNGVFQTANNATAGGSNAFISKFALAAEANQTTYPALPSGSTGATLTDSGPDSISLQCYSQTPSDTLSMTVNLTLTTQSVWPPPTGTVLFSDSLSAPPAYGQEISALENPAKTLSPIYLTFTDGWNFDGPTSPLTVNWSATYSGDAVYTPSSVSGYISTPGCQSSTSVAGQAPQGHALRIQPGSSTMQGMGLSQPVLHPVSAKFDVIGPKFSPVPAIPQGNGQRSLAKPSVENQAMPACIAPAQTAMPVFSPTAGAYTSAQNVTITDTTTGAAIYYTTDGTTPTSSSMLYSGAIAVSTTETIQAIAVAAGYTDSAVASASYTINLPPPTFSITVSPSSLTIRPGQSGMATISIVPQNGFASPTTFRCSGLPAGALCSFSPSTVTPSGGTATTTLTIAVSRTISNLRDNTRPLVPGAALAIAFCCLSWKKRRDLRLVLLLFVACLFGASMLAGCIRPPKPMTYKATITAASGTIQQTVPFTVTIE